MRNTDEESEPSCCSRGYATALPNSLTTIKKSRKPIGVCVVSKDGIFIADFVVSATVVWCAEIKSVLSVLLDEGACVGTERIYCLQLNCLQLVLIPFVVPESIVKCRTYAR